MEKLADISKFESLINNTAQARNVVQNGVGPDMTQMMMRTLKPDYVETPEEHAFVYGPGGPTDIALIRRTKGNDYDPSRNKVGEEQYRPMDLHYRNNFMVNDVKQILDKYANKTYINYGNMPQDEKELIKEYFFTKRAGAVPKGEIDGDVVSDGRNRRAYLGDAGIKEYLRQFPVNHIGSEEQHTPEEHNRDILGSPKRPWTIEELIDRVYYDALQDPRYDSRKPGAISDTPAIRRLFRQMHKRGQLLSTEKQFGLSDAANSNITTPHDESSVRPNTIRGEKVKQALELAGNRYAIHKAILDDLATNRVDGGLRVPEVRGGEQYTSDINPKTGKPKARRPVVMKAGYGDAQRGYHSAKRGFVGAMPTMSPDETYEVLKSCSDAIRNGMDKSEALQWIKKVYGLGPEDIKRFVKTYRGGQSGDGRSQSNLYRLNNLPPSNPSVGPYDYRLKQ